jgi:predicted nuclease of predicted toxin-antitoxin system
MKIRYQADADLDERIIRAVRRQEPTLDMQKATAANSGQGLQGLLDPVVLAITAREGRLLVTHDRRTMPTHFAELLLTEKSPGVIIVPRRMLITVAVEWLITIWAASEAEEWVNRIVHLSR